METRQPGLRKRIEHEATGIRHQHRLLAQLIRDLSAALDDGVQARGQQLVSRLRSALRAHFLLEEDVVFPAFRGLHPEHGTAIDSLTDGHRDLWEELERVELSLEGADLEQAARLFAALRDALAAHEAAEEALLSEARRAQP
jgi:iron-sulfur cluster repair protein YtfE (RIC family)